MENQVFLLKVLTTQVIHLTLSEAIDGELILFDIFGKQIKTFLLFFEHQKTIDISDLPEGSYLLMLETNNRERAVRRFVKMNP